MAIQYGGRFCKSHRLSFFQMFLCLVPKPHILEVNSRDLALGVFEQIHLCRDLDMILELIFVMNKPETLQNEVISVELLKFADNCVSREETRLVE